MIRLDQKAEILMIYIPNGKISPHVIRRSKATHLIQSGVNIYYIRDFLGHSSIATTERYLRNAPETTRKAIEKASSSIIIGNDNFYTKQNKDEMIEFLKNLQNINKISKVSIPSIVYLWTFKGITFDKIKVAISNPLQRKR